MNPTGDLNLYAQWQRELTASKPAAGEHTHIWIDKYDDTYHWQECSTCGQINPDHPKTKHTISGRWTLGDYTNCSESNIYVETCSECGWSKSSTNDGTHERAAHTWYVPYQSWVTTYSGYHVKTCSKCSINSDQIAQARSDYWAEPHHLADGTILGITTGKEGRCVECGNYIITGYMSYGGAIMDVNGMIVFNDVSAQNGDSSHGSYQLITGSKCKCISFTRTGNHVHLVYDLYCTQPIAEEPTWEFVQGETRSGRNEACLRTTDTWSATAAYLGDGHTLRFTIEANPDTSIYVENDLMEAQNSLGLFEKRWYVPMRHILQYNRRL